MLTARHTRAWYLLTGMVALHVLDEAMTGFLEFYNPLVLRARAVWPWFPMPTFTFPLWLAGLGTFVLALVLLGSLVRRGTRFALTLSLALSILMTLNGLGHLFGSIYSGRWLPGSTSSPLLLMASISLAVHTWRRARAGARQSPNEGPAV